jgi:hypothetical protein
MLNIHFEGWFQCRLATEPDPSDEPRGISGFTFAVAGEPNFDRIIRLQYSPLVIERSHTPRVGVNVHRVDLDGQPILAQDPLSQALVGAQVELLDDAKFIGQNYIVALARKEPIDPFHLKISKEIDGKREPILSRKDLWNPNDPDLDLYTLLKDKDKDLQEIEAIIARRQPIGKDPAVDVIRMQAPDVAEAIKIFDTHDYLKQRLTRLTQDLQDLPNTLNNAIQIAALQTRIAKLSPEDLAPLLLVRVNYQFDINGHQEVTYVNQDLLHGKTSVDVAWPIKFWMGAWDSDALCGYLKGVLSIPFWQK